MKKIVNSFTITTILLLTITSCSTECDEPTKVPLRNLNEYVSYTGYDTLRFLHNNIDTQIFIGQGINYFWVRKPGDDTQCSEDHQSLFIEFRNSKSTDVIKLEYVYDMNFWRVGGVNTNTFYKFYLNNVYFGDNVQLNNIDTLVVNNERFCYCGVQFFTNSVDSSMYIFYRIPKLGSGGILKFKDLSSNQYVRIK